MKKPSWPDVSGPLACHAAGYRVELRELGYLRSTASAHMYLISDVSRWLAVNKIAADDFTADRVDRFLADRRAAGHHRRLSRRGLIPLLGYLVANGVLAENELAGPESPTDRLGTEFASYLATERGFAQRTIAQVQPESPDNTVATVAGCIGLALGLLDDWLSGNDPHTPKTLSQQLRLVQSLCRPGSRLMAAMLSP